MEDGQLPGNILDKFESRHSSAELKGLEIPFEFAKPTALIRFLMSVCGVEDGDITLDFFAGSGSTGHAAIEYAFDTGQRRPFICVQLPEQTSIDSEEYKAGFKTISAITIERIKRAATKLQESLASKETDCGFRVFQLAESNFRRWNGQLAEVGALAGQLDLHVDHIRDDRTSDSILYELLLKSGFSLTTKVERVSFGEKTVYSISDGAMLICLDRDLTTDVIKAIADRKPERVILLDEGFAGNDQLKTNAVQIMKSKGVTSFRTV